MQRINIQLDKLKVLVGLIDTGLRNGETTVFSVPVYNSNIDLIDRTIEALKELRESAEKLEYRQDPKELSRLYKQKEQLEEELETVVKQIENKMLRK